MICDNTGRELNLNIYGVACYIHNARLAFISNDDEDEFREKVKEWEKLPASELSKPSEDLSYSANVRHMFYNMEHDKIVEELDAWYKDQLEQHKNN